MIRAYVTSVILAVALALTLSGCGFGASAGVLPAKYDGSFIRGDAFAAACEDVFDGEWLWTPTYTGTEDCTEGPFSPVINPLS